MNYQKKTNQQAKQNAPKVLQPDLQAHELWDETTEQACIGAVLTNPNAYYKIARIVNDGKAFYLLRHQWIWEAMKYLAEHELDIDNVSLSHRLNDTGQLKDIGGPAYLTQLVSNIPTSSHAETYARMVQSIYSRRLIVSLGEEIKAAGMSPEEISLERILSKVSSQVDTTMDNVSKNIVMTMADYSHERLDAAEKDFTSGKVLVPIKSGITGLDGVIDGFLPGTYQFGARTHDGKTITLASIALNVAQMGKKVLYINCADGDERDVLSMFESMESGLHTQMVLRRNFNQQQFSSYSECLRRMAGLGLFIKHQIGITARDIWAHANIIQRTYGLDMIVIDYIQRMTVDKDVRVSSKTEALAYTSSAINQIRKKFDIPILFGAQLNEYDNDVEPRLIHTMWSKDVIKDVDVGITSWHQNRAINELIFNVEKNKKTHSKRKFRAGFSNVTGRVSYNYNTKG
jgi:replicative DNA helicase